MLRRLFLAAALAGGLLAACAPPAPTPEVSTPSPPASAATTVVIEPAADPAPTATRPPVREDFAATDPATVALAAGRPQLVEFFAFY